VRLIKHCKRLPRVPVKSPFLEILKTETNGLWQPALASSSLLLSKKMADL